MSKETQNKIRKILRIGFVSSGILFVIIGLLREEHMDVLIKAVRICLECIGIG